MIVTLKRGEPTDEPIFQRLMQLYLYDFSDFLPLYLDDQGLFPQAILADYFVNPTKDPFLIMADTHLAGFILVSSELLLPGNAGGKRLKEFFVVRGFRRQGIGRQAARQAFNAFPGQWEVGVVTTNLPAQHFWETTINEYTGGKYMKDVRDDVTWCGSIFSLHTP